MHGEIIEETWRGRKIRIHVPEREYLYILTRITQGKLDSLLSELEWEFVE